METAFDFNGIDNLEFHGHALPECVRPSRLKTGPDPVIVDLADHSGSIPDYDVCIVGSGPAAMTVARELASRRVHLCVLESGRLKPEPFGDRLRRVESDGIAIKEYSRERVFGGASTTWAGLSSPLDEIDFAPREYVAHSGWPIARAELIHYYELAAERYRFAHPRMFTGSGFGALRAKGPVQPAWRAIDEKIFLAAVEPQNFAREHRAIFDGARADLYYDATVVELKCNKNTASVDRARVRTSRQNEVSFSAKVWIVACGGIENARLLLQSASLCDRGLGNERDAVGRYFMNHPKNYHGILKLRQAVTDAAYYFGCIFEGYAGYAGLRIAEGFQKERKLLNSYVRFEPLFPWSGNTGVESLVTLVKRSRFVMRQFKARGKGKVISLRDYSETGDDSDIQNERKTAAGWIGLGWNVVAHAPSVAQYAYYRVFERKKPAITSVRLRNFMEMEPVPENRITLTQERDALGCPVPRASHRCTALDRRSLVELHRTLQIEFEETGLGTLETGLPSLASDAPWPIDQDASHHMGTTRMGTDPATSVVDPQGRVHTVSNLYMAGASVFPTSGCANPTWTIVALSIRLAEHLATRVLGLAPETAP